MREGRMPWAGHVAPRVQRCARWALVGMALRAVGSSVGAAARINALGARKREESVCVRAGSVYA